MHLRTGHELHVLGVATEEPGRLVQREVEPVDPDVAVLFDDDRAHTDPVAFVDTELGGRFRRDLLDATNDLVARHGGEHTSRRHRRVALELVDVAVADADRLRP